MEQVKDFNGRMDWVLVLASIYLVGAGVECTCGLGSAALLGTHELTSRAQIVGAMLAMLAGLGALVVLVAYVIAGIIFLILLYRACGQAMNFTSPFKECSPALAVWYWFIPLANLAMPHQVMVDLLRSSAESIGKRFDGLVIHLWWLAFLAKVLFGVVIYFMSSHNPQTPAELAKTEQLVGIGGALGFIAAALFIWMLYGWRGNYARALQQMDAPIPAAVPSPELMG